MGFFRGTDLCGLVVVLDQGAFDHARERHPEMARHWNTIVSTLERPQLIVANRQLPGLNRTAAEKYVSFSQTLNAHVVVPVKILTQAQPSFAHGTLPVGTRLATTAYTADAVPNEPIIWKP